MSRSNKVVVPDCKAALNQMKYEIAAELGLFASHGVSTGADTEFAGELGSVGGGTHIQWREVTSRDVGSIGGSITQRLVAQAEKVLNGYV
ncbi:alpha/beta-type small acid-soluble spore protein [Paenibacillus sp. JDR-2]|uniref:alpha/beta-type small acid-soluble spore protein n=1 Tax=Paenibacillus sp. (strain JDR-2) TaxID=324057 RepID=UPI0001667CD0|nr:alpha/beta-type small acid-soluble spore protein [Paenibacillus sp. JDR-2]ACT04384.1 small acid-soluble spore protein alpha/beta type [Paenibacillus sp. JDR-2]